MKPQKRNAQGLYLQKRNNRWKWMAGATAATAAGVTASQANTITINLSGNFISATDGNHLNADLTGDGHPDLTLTGAKYRAFTGPTHYYSARYRFASVFLNGVFANIYSRGGVNPTYSAHLGSRARAGVFFTNYLTGSIPIFFKDLHINGGAPTSGFLTVTVVPNEVQLDSFTYTSNTPVVGTRVTVPDQGSSLALLAMGAGGILALRRWRAAQQRNPQLPAKTP